MRIPGVPTPIDDHEQLAIQRRPRVLVVDDEAPVRRSIAAILEQDFEVRTCGDGHAALALILSERFDVVCTDFKMPGIDGGELLRAIEGARFTVGAVLVTGRPDAYLEWEERQPEAMRTSALPVSVVSKPFDPPNLIAVVHQSEAAARIRRRTMCGKDASLAGGPVAEQGDIVPAMIERGDAAAGFNVGVSPEKVQVEGWGFWNEEVASAFGPAVVGVCSENTAPVMTMDLTRLRPMRGEGQQSFRTVLDGLAALGIDKLTISTSSQLTKLQLMRIAKAHTHGERVEFA